MRKILNIPCDDNARIINMDETPLFLEMNYSTTIDFIGKKNVEYLTTGREHYRISIILSVTGDGYKLPPFVIIKGEEGKTIEKKLNELYYVKKHEIFVHCQKQGWCTTELFILWLKEVFIPYQTSIAENCLLVMDKASSHISAESIKYLNENNISFMLIPAGMTPECQPLDITVNKIFKNNIKQLFEEKRLFYEELNGKVKLQNARLNLIDFVYRVWSNDNIL